MKTNRGKEGTMAGRNKEKERLSDKAPERKAAGNGFGKSAPGFVMRNGVQLSLFVKDWKGLE